MPPASRPRRFAFARLARAYLAASSDGNDRAARAGPQHQAELHSNEPDRLIAVAFAIAAE